MSSGDRAGARSQASHFSQAGCPAGGGGPAANTATNGRPGRGRGTLSAQPGQHLLRGLLQCVVANEAMPHPAGTSGQSFRVGSESSSEETEAPREAQLRSGNLGDSAQVWVRLDLQAVIPLPSSDLPHPGVLPSSPSQHHLAQPQVSSSPFAYENHCALQVLSAAAGACLNNCLCPAPARPLFWTRLQVLRVPPHLLVGVTVRALSLETAWSLCIPLANSVPRLQPLNEEPDD